MTQADKRLHDLHNIVKDVSRRPGTQRVFRGVCTAFLGQENIAPGSALAYPFCGGSTKPCPHLDYT